MKKVVVIALFTFFSGALVSCKSPTDDSVTDDPSDYVSITNLTVSAEGTSLAASPTFTWLLGFPIFSTLEAGLGSTSAANSDVQDWVDIGVATSHSFSGLTLTECSSYYPMVRAKNSAGAILDTHVVTTPFRVDLTDPTAPAGLVVTENGRETASSLVAWTVGTDNCELSGYDYAVGTTSGGTEELNWSPVTTNSHRATSGISLNYGIKYYTSVKAIDTVDRESTVATSSAWRLRSPAAILYGTQNLASNDFNVGASYVGWSSSTYDNDYFSHSTVTNPETLTITAAGDYLLRMTMPFSVTSGCATRCSIKAQVLVNGTALPDAVANSSYVFNASSFTDSSNHLVVYMPGLAANDEIKVYVDRGTAVTGVVISEGIQAYMEYLYPDRSFFYATASQTVTSSNLNLAAANISWTQDTASSDFTHVAGTPADITLNTTGNFLVSVNFPLLATGACVTRNNVKLQITLNNVQFIGGQANQGGIDCQAGHTSGSVHWTGLVPALAGDVLRVLAVAEASNSVIEVDTGKLGSIIIEKLNSIENYISLTGTRTVGSTNWNVATASALQWSTQVATDATTFSHSTVINSHQVTVTKAGRYLVLFTDHLTSATVRANVRVRLQKNGVDISGGICTSNIITNSNANNESSCSLTFLLNSVAVSDVITLTTIQEAAAATVTASSPANLTLLRVR